MMPLPEDGKKLDNVPSFRYSSTMYQTVRWTDRSGKTSSHSARYTCWCTI